jgi:hypothetical protein
MVNPAEPGPQAVAPETGCEETGGLNEQQIYAEIDKVLERLHRDIAAEHAAMDELRSRMNRKSP